MYLITLRHTDECAGVCISKFSKSLHLPRQKFLVSAELAHLRRVSHNPKAILQGETALCPALVNVSHQKFQDATLDVSWQWKGFNHLKRSLVIVAPFPKQPPPAVLLTFRHYTLWTSKGPILHIHSALWGLHPWGQIWSPGLAEVAELSWSQMEMVSVCSPWGMRRPEGTKASVAGDLVLRGWRVKIKTQQGPFEKGLPHPYQQTCKIELGIIKLGIIIGRRNKLYCYYFTHIYIYISHTEICMYTCTIHIYIYKYHII